MPKIGEDTSIHFIKRLHSECNFDPSKYTAGKSFDFTRQASMLNDMLQLAVPMWVDTLQREQEMMGDDEFFKEMSARAGRCGDYLAENGDALMFKVEGKTAKAFNSLAEGIACLAFLPGGVTVFGTHWFFKKVRKPD